MEGYMWDDEEAQKRRQKHDAVGGFWGLAFALKPRSSCACALWVGDLSEQFYTLFRTVA